MQIRKQKEVRKKLKFVPVPTHLLSNAHKPMRENGQLDGIQVGPNFLNIATTDLQEIWRIFMY